MDEISSITSIDQKMAAMRIKNLELLKRHQEVEQDKQLAISVGATTSAETVQDKKIMKGAIKNRLRPTGNQQRPQENQNESARRAPVRRKLENDRKDNQSQRAQRVDYTRLQHEHSKEINDQRNNTNSKLHEYAYPFHYKLENTNDVDEPAHAKKLVIVNNKVDRIGSGRFNQQQRTQERTQRKREERMHRSNLQNTGHSSGTNEFHIDVPSMPIWQTAPMPSVHVQLVPTNLNGHHTGIDHLVNTNSEQMEQTSYIHNFIYPTPAQTPSFNGNSTIYFTHSNPPMNNNSPVPQLQQTTHFHGYHSTRTFENSNRHQFHASPIFQTNQQQDSLPQDFSFHIHQAKLSEHENKFAQMKSSTNDFERANNNQHSLSPRFNYDNRFHSRSHVFYDNLSQQQSNNNNNTNNPNNHFFRSSNTNRYQRNNNNTNLPLSAYMNTDNLLNHDENLNNRNTNYQKRRPTQQRNHHQDKHQFPLSSYDPRQFNFSNNNNRTNTQWRKINNTRNNSNNHNNGFHGANDVDLIEEYWEDNNTELIGTRQTINNNIDDNDNMSLSTSINLKESTVDELSINDCVNPSNSDNNIIESIDKLQEELKLQEVVDEQIATTNNQNSVTNNEPTTYDTAHFMQWAKEKFREELAGRLTAQEIEQHDAVVTDDNDEDDIDDQLIKTNTAKVNGLEEDLNKKLTIDENLQNSTQSIANSE